MKKYFGFGLAIAVVFVTALSAVYAGGVAINVALASAPRPEIALSATPAQSRPSSAVMAAQ